MPPAVHAFTNEDLDVYMLGGNVQINPGSVGFDGTIYKTALESSFSASEAFRINFIDQNWANGPLSSFRLQFVHTHSSLSAGASFGSLSQKWINFYDITNGRTVYRIKNLSNVAGFSGWDSRCQLEYNTNTTPGAETWVAVGAPFQVPLYSVNTIEVIVGDSGGSFKWWVNNLLVAQLTGDTKFTSSTAIESVGFWGWGNNGLGLGRNTFAGIILCTADYMPYGLHVFNPQITGATAYGAGNAEQTSGAYTDINEKVLSTVTGLTMDAAGLLATFAAEDYPAALTGSPIMMARVAANARRGFTGPQNLKVAIQQAAGISYSTALALNGIGFTTVAANFPLDFNGDPWSAVVWNASEPGVESAA
jgi:hypothetical protein